MSMRKRLMTINTQKMGPRARDDSEITEEEEEDGEPLSPAGRLFHQPHFNCYIIAIMGSGKTIDIDAVKARMEVTMLRHPRFSSILTINDVLLGITSAGFSRYLNRRYGETANGEKKLKNLPTNIRLRTAVIVNIRPTPGILAMSEMMEGDRSIMWGNWLGFIIVPFHITMCDDPLDYIRKAMKIAERKRNSLEAVFTYICSCLSIILFGIKAAASALCYRVLRHTTVSLSNIVGPVEEIGFCGHPLVYLAPSVYGHPQAVTLHFQSYMNKIEMVLAVDELTVPDPHQLMEDMAESLKLIKDAVVTTNKINLSSG